MSCPTCAKTMHRLIVAGGVAYSLCPTCGTVKIEASDPDLAGGFMDRIYVPKLVERCREYERLLEGQWMPTMLEWRSRGIAEAINTPGNRPGEK